uniref:Xaa-Pro aminopeptidase P n=1 Tax=Phaeomonas parva TaxID=124430 RepID=A0A7S1XZD6_9STRA|mmetsp:Transcript_9000/g.26183  ORF Transcript_9000/g.26183 Transcript_9000/m.26183 type:complete len:676 (+) Transcript_9000:37-2064(+)
MLRFAARRAARPLARRALSSARAAPQDRGSGAAALGLSLGVAGAIGYHELNRKQSPLALAAAAPEAPLATVRRELEAQGYDAFLVPTDDPHLSEYPPTRYARREYISGFTGSAGVAVITPAEALLWTDGRYHQQAASELSSDWTLMKSGQPGVPALQDWLTKSLGAGRKLRVAIDATVHSGSFAEGLRRKLEAAGHELVVLPPDARNPVDVAWDADQEKPRPPVGLKPVREHPAAFAGKTTAEKLVELRGAIADKGADALVVAMLDEVMWLCNVRGADVAYNPVAVSYAIVTGDDAMLFMRGEKLPEDLRKELTANGVTVRDYDDFLPTLRGLGDAGKKVWIDGDRTNYAAAVAVPAAQRVSGMNPVTLLKSIKNPQELKGMYDSHVRDACALVRFMSWIERQVVDEGKEITEVELDEMLTGKLRAELPRFIEPSFPTIAGAGPNGAIIHYRAAPETCGSVGRGTVLLVDSGGQYLDGTTDCTRTMVFGEDEAHPVPQRIKETFTRVLQGHIKIDRSVFPEGTPGFVLDAFAREELWRAGQDYAHGTGHGVGAALNVHEGPHSISPRFWNKQPLLAGMVVSNEPGFYEPGGFGIRIENLIAVEETGKTSAATGKKFLGFKKLTQAPICKDLIVKENLTPAEVAWVNDYHEEIYAKLSPHLNSVDRNWLFKACAPL